MSLSPAFLPLVRPALPDAVELQQMFGEILGSGIVTTGRVTRAFEEAVSRELEVEHVVMVNHGTTALMLAARGLELTGEVIVPSYSWTATAGALVWNGVDPVFADITPGRLTLDPAAAEVAITPRTSAIMPVNVFGVPPDIEAFEELGRRYGLPVLYDSAQGLGSRYRGRRCGGFGVAECYSLSPTKVVTAVEGGLVITSDASLAAAVRSMRDSGKSEDGSDIVRLGLSGRPSELHAAVALSTFGRIESLVAERHERMDWYREALAGLPGLYFQEIPHHVITTGNYFVVFLDRDQSPITSVELRTALKDAGIQSKQYFHPAIHLQEAYAHLRERYEGRLPVTEKASAEGLALPLFGSMTRVEVERVAAGVRKAWGTRVAM